MKFFLLYIWLYNCKLLHKMYSLYSYAYYVIKTRLFSENTDASGIRKEASGDTRRGAQALEANQHTLFSHLKMIFKQKFRPKSAQNCVFFFK